MPEPGPAGRLASPETEHDTGLFMAVTTELGDLILGPPGTTPAESGHSTHLRQ
jgi:hypothetical protein